jgi:hypothetical protein
MLPRLSAALDAGDTAAAQAVDAEVAAILPTVGALPRALEQQLAPLHARLAELKRWQHWSNQRRRRALCAEIEQLPTLSLHPDAVASRVHDARAEWTRLDAMEGQQQSGESSGISRRFHGACQRALKPAQAYFERRDSVRDAQRVEIEELLARHAHLPGDSDDFKALSSLRHELATRLRSLDGLNPRDRNRFARRLKEAIAALAARIERRDLEVEQAKTRLIERARELAAKPDRANARSARELQQQWTALGSGQRSTDQRQWREFRKACDAIFSGLDGERRQREAESQAQVDRARTLLAEAEALLADPARHDDTLPAQRKDLAARWRDCATTDRALDKRFNQLLDALAARTDELARTRRLGRFTIALERYRRVRRIERDVEAAGDAPWNDAELPPEFAGLNDRCRRAASGQQEPLQADEDAARDLLVRLEFLGGIVSPAEDSARRMNYQVSRLSARLRGGSAIAADRELSGLLAEWFALAGTVSVELDERFERAVQAALSTLP